MFCIFCKLLYFCVKFVHKQFFCIFPGQFPKVSPTCHCRRMLVHQCTHTFYMALAMYQHPHEVTTWRHLGKLSRKNTKKFSLHKIHKFSQIFRKHMFWSISVHFKSFRSTPNWIICWTVSAEHTHRDQRFSAGCFPVHKQQGLQCSKTTFGIGNINTTEQDTKAHKHYQCPNSTGRGLLLATCG